MTIVVDRTPTLLVGFPASSWAFAIRVWLALALALYVSFLLELQSPSSAALTVTILAIPTRGQGFERAGYRLIATAAGVVASIAIAGVFAQTDALLIVVLAAWIGLCVYVAGLVGGNRAYAATLGITTVSFVLINQIDTPQNVFAAAVGRGTGIAIGVVAVALVNDFLGAANYYPRVAAQLESLRSRVEDYAFSAPDRKIETTKVAATLHDIAALRHDISGLAWESSDGAARSAAARTVLVELVVQLAIARVLRGHAFINKRVLEYGENRLLRGKAYVRECIDGVLTGKSPLREWRTPSYRVYRIAIENGLRAGACFLVAAAFFASAGWPLTDVSLSLVAVIIGLAATVPNARIFAALAVVSSPISGVLAGVLQFVILDGADAFPLLAIGVAPFIIGLALAITSFNRIISTLGRLNLIFMVALLGPTNPPVYDPQSFLFFWLFSCLATTLFFAIQTVIPPVSTHRRLRLTLESARREFDSRTPWRDQRLAPEECIFRDATLIEEIVSDGGTSDQELPNLAELMEKFERVSARRLFGDHSAVGAHAA